ncbi:uncharacterized protein PHACADRAFT_152310 [Phanerochaete carnosa HHB-10118-sp]|uniref:SET domain-containing protein n=1 Tax=Phanerochaete carnosa (strain HHB-10118-sp) TaxID=650164 RepID=K5VGR0_PHACS|nr:uncharacterized protein PHACADRAFT_152310 [Phanerochaete carnosa HHB-10118-sp]EKM50383.1 hypothetical protein PHACADRAFT_152310 [Phanerochaete carnosa HHB-10118-sp]
MSPASGLPSTLTVTVSPLTGRSYRAACDIPKGTCVLDVSTPYADMLYKNFRKEVCAECWRYELGRTDFLTCRDFVEAGLWFCDGRCRDIWLEREGIETVALLRTLETARIRSGKGKAKQENFTTPEKITEDALARAWEEVASQEKQAKTLARWKMIKLDDFEADLARYVLVALVHLYRELKSNATRSDKDTTSEPADISHSSGTLNFGGATWRDFAALQSGELPQTSMFPGLLENWIRVYQVLKSRFSYKGPRSSLNTHSSPTDQAAIVDLSDVITPQNVRTALGADLSNSFGIWQVPVAAESEGLGFGTYPIPSIFNHHCSPNVLKERMGRRLRFVTTEKARTGDELCISYGHVDGMSLEERRRYLQDGWFFLCQCSRCINEVNLQTSGDSVDVAGQQHTE